MIFFFPFIALSETGYFLFSLNPRTIFLVIKFFLGGPQKKNIFWFVGILFLFFFVCKQLLFLFSDNIASLYQQQKCHKKGHMKMSLTCYKLNYISCSTPKKDWKGKQNQFFLLRNQNKETATIFFLSFLSPCQFKNIFNAPRRGVRLC